MSRYVRLHLLSPEQQEAFRVARRARRKRWRQRHPQSTWTPAQKAARTAAKARYYARLSPARKKAIAQQAIAWMKSKTPKAKAYLARKNARRYLRLKAQRPDVLRQRQRRRAQRRQRNLLELGLYALTRLSAANQIQRNAIETQ